MRFLRMCTIFALVAVFLVGCGDDDTTPDSDAGTEDASVLLKPYIAALPPPVHISHRGGAGLYPENTLEAFAEVIQDYQTDVIETDLHMTADGTIVIIHDFDVDRTTDATGKVKDLTLAQLKALDAAYRFDPDGNQSYPRRGQGIQIPTLDEAFAQFPTMHFNLEVKAYQDELEQDLYDVIVAYAMEELVCWGSSDDDSALRLRAIDPDICIYYPSIAAGCFVFAAMDGKDPLAECPDHYDALNLPEGGSIPEVVSVAHALNIPIYTWTIDRQDFMVTLFGYGVDGIITDRPDILRTVINDLAFQ